MNIKHIKYFVSTFEDGSISTAAKSNDVTMQAISKAVNDLEVHFDEKLFERTKSGTKPTMFGRLLYPKARACVDAYEEFANFSERDFSLDALSHADARTPFSIALCSPDFKHNDKLRARLSSMIEKSTNLSISFALEAPSLMMQELESGTYDALLTIGVLDRENIDCTPIGTMPTGIMTSLFHPLAKSDFVSLDDLKRFPAGHSVRHDGHNASILAMYEEKDLVGDVQRIDSLADAASFMALHNGYFFSCYMPHLGKAQAGTVVRPIDPSTALRVPICFNTLKGSRTASHRLVENFMLLAMTAEK